ncbi:MmpS family transport accessory protein [Microbacterium sp. USTB-Y]|uniref:MmpS family transport accessory protein n=1 Tax=Microbacterium sp. USTB-Y TaxID=2823692 RepID=UPI00203CC9AC|nr:MmpS family transport accessory protein [Microbacterium sp. USTB-Y]
MPEQQPFVPQEPQKTGSGLGIAALILGIVALVGAVIPFLNYVAWVVGVVGLILGIIALVQKNRRKGVAVAGTIVSGVAIILSIVLAIVYTVAFASAVSSAVDSAASTMPSSAPQPSADSTSSAPVGGESTIVYEITGTIPGATITYSTLDNGSVQSATASGQALPWTKTLTVKNDGLLDANVFSVSVVGGADSGDIGCKITVDGKVVSEQTASGQFAVASCTASNLGGN